MNARIQPLSIDPAILRGLSPKLIESHHQNNYGGAVKRLNATRTQLAALPFDAAPGFQVNWLKREELIATNSMVLHELYFASLGGDGVTMEPPMQRMPPLSRSVRNPRKRWCSTFARRCIRCRADDAAERALARPGRGGDVGRIAAGRSRHRRLLRYGHEVGRSSALRLQAAGSRARYLRGGIDARTAAGHPAVAKPRRGEAP